MEDTDTTISFRERFRNTLRQLASALAVLPGSGRKAFVLATILFLVSSFLIVVTWSDQFLVEIPRSGGSLSEGIIGRPRFINPVIAKSDADRDMAALVYSGLLKATPKGGLIPDLAESYVVSPDGLTYTFTLKEELVWHDGTAITSEDVLFTIEKIRDSALAIKSPKRASWEGVTVETPNVRTVVFRISQPYAPFLENATIGIIPKHIWKDVPNDEFDVSYHNIEPIGSGPYRVVGIVRDTEKGLPRYYDLVAFRRYALGEPYITDLRIQFFGNEQELIQAYTDKTVDQIHGLEPKLAAEFEAAGHEITRTPLPRVFSAFFNQNQRPIFADVAVRKALDTAVDKDKIVEEVLSGSGQVQETPLPFLDMATGTEEIRGTGQSIATSTLAELHDERIHAAQQLLEDAGWNLNAAGVYEKTDKTKKKITLLEFSVSMPDVPELRLAAEMMKADWERMGAAVTIKVFDPSTFAGEVLIPRKYDVLFYGQIVGRVPDPYAYWHSSQRNPPGLNVALYVNKKVDSLLEEARTKSDEAERNALLRAFVTEVQKDTPAIFLYSPDFIYATKQEVRGKEIGFLSTESERFLDISNWYIESERVWKWFADRTTR